MTKRASSIDEVHAALPAVREAVRKDIQSRIDAGEAIASMDDLEMRERSRALMEGVRVNRIPKKSAA